MTVQLAKARRLTALNHRNTDRMLVAPAAHTSQVDLPDDGTVAAYLIDALGHGCCLDDLETETGWSKSTVIINLYKVAKKSGVGIHRRAKELHLVLPEGSDHIYPRTKVVVAGGTIRPAMDDVIFMPDQTA